MAYIKKYIIDAPNDPEMNIRVRNNIEYYMVFPTGYNENEEYGLTFCISGYGDTIDSEYYLNKLCTYISDKHNNITVGVRYHNDARTNSDFSIDIPAICRFYNIDADYFYSVNNKTLIERLFDLIIERRLLSLENRLALSTEAFHKYSSFGFMPAIDHLVVLSNILKHFRIDKSNIIAFGTSYGGYIASLMGKYAPNTFSLIIDNSGFCISQLQEILGYQLGGVTGAIPMYKDGRRYEIPINAKTLWSLDETSDLYFSDSHKLIRNLLIEDHRTKSDTMYCCYHSVKDTLSPIILKDKMYNMLSKYNLTYYRRVEEKDIDGELFKTTEHGMRASLRDMYDFSMLKFKDIVGKVESKTDFDLCKTNSFVCLDRQYNFSYSTNGIEVSIVKYRIQPNVIRTNEVGIPNPNTISINKEIVLKIVDLIPTMEEGLIYILQNSISGILEDGKKVAQDYENCVNSIKSIIQSELKKNLSENKLEPIISKIEAKLKILYLEYNLNVRENITNTIKFDIITSFNEFKNEVNRVFNPLCF
jgi:hypothetical protein